jgi:hypothetical protein
MASQQHIVGTNINPLTGQRRVYTRRQPSKPLIPGDCQFPFRYNRKTFNKCAPRPRSSASTMMDAPWCATAVNPDTRDVTSWAYCPPAAAAAAAAAPAAAAAEAAAEAEEPRVVSVVRPVSPLRIGNRVTHRPDEPKAKADYPTLAPLRPCPYGSVFSRSSKQGCVTRKYANDQVRKHNWQALPNGTYMAIAPHQAAAAPAAPAAARQQEAAADVGTDGKIRNPLTGRPVLQARIRQLVREGRIRAKPTGSYAVAAPPHGDHGDHGAHGTHVTQEVHAAEPVYVEEPIVEENVEVAPNNSHGSNDSDSGSDSSDGSDSRSWSADTADTTDTEGQDEQTRVWEENVGLYPNIQNKDFLPKLLKKKEFLEEIAPPMLQQEDSDACAQANFEQTSVQRLVSKFINPETPYNSLLVYHGVGVGKTCSAVSIAEGFLTVYPNKKVFIISPPAIQQAFQRTVFDASRLKYNHQQHRQISQQCTGDTYLRLSGMARNPDAAAIEKRVKRIISGRYRFLTYLRFAGLIRRTMRRAKQQFGTEEAVAEALRDLFAHSVVIFDEAHNIRDQADRIAADDGSGASLSIQSSSSRGSSSSTSSTSSTSQNQTVRTPVSGLRGPANSVSAGSAGDADRLDHDPSFDAPIDPVSPTARTGSTVTAKGTKDARKKLPAALLALLRYVPNIKLVLLSATPMYNTHEEIVFLLNLLLANDKRKTLTVGDIFTDGGNILPEAEPVLGSLASQYISYMRGENPKTFPLRLWPPAKRQLAAWPTISLLGQEIAPSEQVPAEARLPIIPSYMTGMQALVVRALMAQIFAQTGGASASTASDSSGSHSADTEGSHSADTEGSYSADTEGSHSADTDGSNSADTEGSNSADTGEGSNSADTEGSSDDEASSNSDSDSDSGSESESESGDKEAEEARETGEERETEVHVTDYGIGSLENDVLQKASDFVFPVPIPEVEARPRVAIGDAGFHRVFEDVVADGTKRYRLVGEGTPDFLKIDQLHNHSAKMHTILKSVIKAEGIVFLYSRYVATGGVVMAMALEMAGFEAAGRPPLLSLSKEHRPDRKQCALCPLSMREHAVGQADHAFVQARYVLLTGDKELTPNKDELVKLASAPTNVNGEQVKVVVGSSVASEGLDFKCIRQIDIIDTWFHMNKIEQVIGRGVRFCSHKALPPEKQNVTVNLHAAVFDAEDEVYGNRETIDVFAYRKAQMKALRIGRVSRLLKEHAMDCHLNHNVNVLKDMPDREIVDSQRKRRVVQPTNLAFSSVCDYMENCEYECKPALGPSGPGGHKKHADTSTYSPAFMTKDIEKAVTVLQTLFARQSLFTHDDVRKAVLAQLPGLTDGVLARALQRLLQDPTTVVHRVDAAGAHRTGHIVYREPYYLFQPAEMTDKRAPVQHRSAPYMDRQSEYSETAAAAAAAKETMEADETEAGAVETAMSADTGEGTGAAGLTPHMALVHCTQMVELASSDDALDIQAAGELAAIFGDQHDTYAIREDKLKSVREILDANVLRPFLETEGLVRAQGILAAICFDRLVIADLQLKIILERLTGRLNTSGVSAAVLSAVDHFIIEAEGQRFARFVPQQTNVLTYYCSTAAGGSECSPAMRALAVAGDPVAGIMSTQVDRILRKTESDMPTNVSELYGFVVHHDTEPRVIFKEGRKTGRASRGQECANVPNKKPKEEKIRQLGQDMKDYSKKFLKDRRPDWALPYFPYTTEKTPETMQSRSLCVCMEFQLRWLQEEMPRWTWFFRLPESAAYMLGRTKAQKQDMSAQWKAAE